MSLTLKVSDPVLGREEQEAVMEVLRSGQLTQGKTVQEFEEKFAEFVGTNYAVACSSGTAALHLALLAEDLMNCSSPRAVLVPALTYIATANVVRYCGATPIFVDVDRETWCMDPEDLARAYDLAVSAGLCPVGVIPVHLYGIPASMESIIKFADDNDMWVVEDAAEAHGATYGNRKIGSLAKSAAFSFYGNKLITTGEGGMLTTDNKLVNNDARMYRGQGQLEKRFYHHVIGYNYRMTEIAAAIGIVQLGRFDESLKMRKEIVLSYQDQLHEAGIDGWQHCPEDCESSSWMFALKFPVGKSRDNIAQSLANYGIETRPVFIPMTDQPPYRQNGLHNASEIADRGLCLPTHANMTVDDVSFVVEKIAEALL